MVDRLEDLGREEELKRQFQEDKERRQGLLNNLVKLIADEQGHLIGEQIGGNEYNRIIEDLKKKDPNEFGIKPLNLSYLNFTFLKPRTYLYEIYDTTTRVHFSFRDMFRDSSLFANLEGANLSRANFENANLEGANFKNANLEGANFENANFKGANFVM